MMNRRYFDQKRIVPTEESNGEIRFEVAEERGWIPPAFGCGSPYPSTPMSEAVYHGELDDEDLR